MPEKIPLYIMELLISRFQPARVYLYSQGGEGLPGMLELAVVLPKAPSRHASRKFNQEFVQRLGWPAQVLFFDEEDFSQASKAQGRMAYGIARYGRLIYRQAHYAARRKPSPSKKPLKKKIPRKRP